jgi:regulator of RNase E activity RraA
VYLKERQEERMPAPIFSAETRAKLEKVSTASIATALFKRGLRNQFVQGVGPVAWKGRNMVGPAFTLRYIPAREDRNPITVFRNADHPQRVAVETCPSGHVLVMDSRKDARAATAGSILITRLALRGAAGVVTDGGFRDAEGIGKLDMPAYYARASAPTNLTLHEAIDINVPVSCGDAAVFPGDILVGDGDGVMVIPQHLADEIATECTGMESFEDFVLEQVLGGAAVIGLYPPTTEKAQSDYAAWRERTGR